MEMSGDFYTLLGRASSSGYRFGLASLSCLCEGRVHASALCSVLGSVKPVPNCRWCYCKALPCLSGNAWLFWICSCAQRTSLCCASGSCMRRPHPHEDTHDQVWLKADSRWAKPNWNSAHKTSKLVWACLSLECQDPTSSEAWLDVPALFCDSSKGGKTCKKLLTFWISPLPAFFSPSEI